MGSTSRGEKWSRFCHTTRALRTRDTGSMPGVMVLLGSATDSSGVYTSGSPKPTRPLMMKPSAMLKKQKSTIPTSICKNPPSG